MRSAATASLLIANLPGDRESFACFAQLLSDFLLPTACWGAEDPSAPAGSGADVGARCCTLSCSRHRELHASSAAAAEVCGGLCFANSI